MLPFLRDHNAMVTNHLSSNLLLAALVMGLSVFTYGFDNGVLDTVQAMDPFIRRFGDLNKKTGKYAISAGHLAYLNSFPLILFALGVVIASQIGERFGRRAVFVLMNCICISGVAICYTSKAYGQFLAGRMLVNMHVGMEAWLIPMFMAEIVPAAIRGAMVSSYTFSHIFATFLSSIITNATSNFNDDSAWKIPVACMFAFPSLTFLLIWLVPESPRWLLRQGKVEHASRTLYYLNSAHKGFVVDDQISLMRQALDESETKGRWKDLFKGTNRARTVIICVAPMCVQLTGQSFASTYGTIFLKQVNVMNPFQATLIKRGILCIGALIPIFVIDRVGRRIIVLIFASLAAASLLIMGGLGSVQPATVSVKKGIVALAIVFPFCYIAYAAAFQTLPAEIPHLSLRDKSSMLAWSISNLSNFVASFTLPYLLKAPYADLGAKVAFIYGSTTVLAVFWTYFFVPDLTGRSLEEVTEMFEQKIAARHSRKWVSTSAMTALTVLENSKDGILPDAPEKQTEHQIEFAGKDR